MKVKLRKRPRLASESNYNPIAIPEINHPSRKGWKNEAYEAYKEAFGTSLADAPHDLSIPFPKNNLAERLTYKFKLRIVKTIFTLVSLFTKERGTHQHGGAGAKGTITFLKNETTDKIPFCQSNKSLPIVIRHSNASFEDDACAQVRAMAFSIIHESGRKEDFLLGTGATVPFWNITSLINFGKYRGKVKNDNWEPQKEWLQNSPTAFISAIEAIRLAPSSYTKMSYYSAIPYAIQGTNLFVKFRVMPVGMDVESGLLSSEQQRKIWMQNRLDQNELPEQYLADEYRERVLEGGVNYRLEAKLRELDPSKDTDEFFNLARYWDDQKYPWVPIAEISTETILDDKATRDLAFWLGHFPKGLEFIKAHSAMDYNSLAEGRVKVYLTPQRLRRR